MKYKKEDMIRFLQSEMDDFKKLEERLGIEDERVQARLTTMIACKEIVEGLICEPVNLQIDDGRVTTGF